MFVAKVNGRGPDGIVKNSWTVTVRRPVVATVTLALALVSFVLSGCSGQESSSAAANSRSGRRTVTTVASTTQGDSPSTTSTSADGNTGHGNDGTAYGSHGMEPAITPVAEIAALGPGPGVGETFRGDIGLNVCGRFLEPPIASVPADGSAESGLVTDGRGGYTLSPPTAAAAGHSATIGQLAKQAGIGLSTGRVTFPTSTSPAQIDVSGTSVQISGVTFDDSTKCGQTPAKVQVWVFTNTSTNTGSDVRSVVVDPQDTPIAEDEMAFVVAVMPESSLPTLPPSALLD